MAELASPLAGGIQAVRRTVPSSVFAPPPAPAPAEPDPVTTSLIQQNSTALGGVSQQLANISGRVSQLSMSLATIQSNLAASSQLDQQREAAKQNREAQLAEQGLREGKEGQIEQKIQNALFAPIQKVAARTQGLLSRLTSFLFTIGGAWLLDKVVLTIKALNTKNTDLLKSVISNVTKNVLVIGGLLLLTRGKFGSIKGVLMALRTGVLRAVGAGLILAPFEAIINLFKRAWNFIANRTGLPAFDTTEEDKPKPENLVTVSMDDIPDGITRTRADGKEQIYNEETKKWTPITGDSSDEPEDTRPESQDGSGYNTEKEPAKGIFRPLFNFLFGKPVDIEPKGDNKGDVDGNTDTSGDSGNVTPPVGDSENVTPPTGESDEDPIVTESFDTLKEKGLEVDPNTNTVVPINKNKENNVSQKISVNEEDISGGNIMPSLMTDSGGNEGASQSPSGTNKGGDKQTPIISSSNGDNNYVYLACKNYQVCPV